MRGLLGATRGADAVVVGGGTLFNDNVGRGTSGLPRLCLGASMAGWLSRTPVVFFGIGCEPIGRRLMRDVVRLASWRRRLWMRDALSVQRVSRLVPGADVRLAADVSLFAFGGLPASQERSGAVIALNHPDVPNLSVEVLERLRSLHSHLTFVSMGQGEESDASRLSDQQRLLIDEVVEGVAWSAAFRAISQAEAVYASRMHAAYMAIVSGTPVSVLQSRPKIGPFVDEFGVPSSASLAAIPETAQVADWQLVESAHERLEAEFESMLKYLSSKAGARH